MEKVLCNASPNNPKLFNDFLESCRVCMAKSLKMNSMFNSDTTDDIVDKLQFCTGIKVIKDEGLPIYICDVCLNNLAVAYKFKTSCILADDAFRKILKDIKLEPPDDAVITNDYEDAECTDDLTDTEPKYDCKQVKEEVLENEAVLKLPDTAKKKKKMKVQVSASKVHKPVIKKVTYKKLALKKNKKLVFIKELQCEPCRIKFRSKEELEVHKKNAHKNEAENWVCEICGKVFIHRASHYSHMKSHRPPGYACEHCDYKTWHKHDLAKHVLRHTGEKRFQCDSCTASFYTSSNLLGHIRRFHQGLKPFACQVCSKTFYDKTKLNRHIDSHNDVKRYECQVCHSFFTRRCYWKKHLDKQHNIVIPKMRPGRQKVNLIVGDNLLNAKLKPLT